MSNDIFCSVIVFLKLGILREQLMPSVFKTKTIIWFQSMLIERYIYVQKCRFGE